MEKDPSKRSLDDIIILSDDEDDDTLFSNVPMPQLKKQNLDEEAGKRFKLTVISWNIDGLEDNGLEERTNEVVKIILANSPDVVFLQEVVPKTYKMLVHKLSKTFEIRLSKSPEGYFNTMLFLKNTNISLSGETEAVFFHGSQMQRHYLLQRLKISGQSLVMMTTHLESLRDYAKERQNQLKKCFEVMLKQDDNANVIFGGDLNLREEDLKKVGGLPKPLADAWEATDMRDSVKYTWDLKLNDNKRFRGSKPRARYDRVYYRKSKNNGLDCTGFELIGTQRLQLPSCKMFPSDHFGLLLTFTPANN